MTSVDRTASVMLRPGAEGGVPGSAYLLVVENDSARIAHLPRVGTFMIGRTSEADLPLGHGSVTRRHAAIRIGDDGTMRIADLDSRNGTRVNGELVQESRTLRSGDVVSVGDVVLVVHVSTPPVVSRATYDEVGWRRRLVEEVERAITHHRSLAVVAIAGIDAATIAAVGDRLRLIDVLGESADRHALVLLLEVDRAQARQLARAALDAVAARAANARAGLAVCPDDGADADTLLLAARKAALAAAPGALHEAADSATYLELGDRRVLVLHPAMTRVYGLLERLATSRLPVLIQGETGVGKENAAYAVHHWSRRTGSFIAVNCAALGPDGLVDSELFGHDRGAFTGATTAKAGLFEAAAGGTLFLDEVAELPLVVQAKLLRALENQTITRVGETRERPIDVRLVAATNESLDAKVEVGQFRKDLLFRLRGAKVELPPLRDRRCEIPPLARELLHRECARAGRPALTISSDAMQALLGYHWPGNVRELKREMERAVAIAPDDRVERSDLSDELLGRDPAAPSPAPAPPAGGERSSTFRPIEDEKRELERRRMAEALEAAGGVKTRAAQLIDMPIRTFTHKLKQYGL